MRPLEPIAAFETEVPRRSEKILRVAVLAAVAVLVFLISLAVGRTYTAITQFDEAVHFDYIVKMIEEPGIPTVGDRLSDETLREIACRGIETTCSTELEHSDIPVDGVNYVLMYGPIYYGIVALISAPFSALTGVSLFDSARTATSLLTAAGAALALLAAFRLGARRGSAVGVLLAVVVAPISLLQGSTISPDSMGLLFAAVICLAATSRFPWGRRLILVTVICCLAALNKANFIPLATAGVWLATIAPRGEAEWRFDWTRDWKRYGIGVAASLLPLAAQYSWNRWRVSVLPPGVPADGGLNTVLYTDQPLFSLVADAVSMLVQPIQDSGFPTSTALWSVAHILQALIFGGAFFIALGQARVTTGEVRAIALAGIAGLLLSFVFLPVTFYVLYHAIGTQPRYGLPIMMVLALAVAASIRGRVASVILLIGGLATYSISFYLVFRGV